MLILSRDTNEGTHRAGARGGSNPFYVTPDLNTYWLLLLYRRCLASCLFGLRSFVLFYVLRCHFLCASSASCFFGLQQFYIRSTPSFDEIALLIVFSWLYYSSYEYVYNVPVYLGLEGL